MRRRWAGVAVVLAAVVAGGLAWRTAGWARYDSAIAPHAIDLARPDALLVTESLAHLPKDALRLPLARDVLTEEFLTYYETHPDVLGMAGAVRRIAYEHDLGWTDEIVRWALDRPAHVALWRDGKGALRHWALVTNHKGFGAVLERAAVVAAADGQLSTAAEIGPEPGKVRLLALQLRTGRTLLLASIGDRVAVFSDPGMVLEADRTARPGADSTLRKLLAEEHAGRTWQRALRLSESAEVKGHTLVVRAHAASFGYQRFFPSLEALRMDFGAGAWSTHALTKADAPGAEGLASRAAWSAAPVGAAACAQLPVNWKAAGEILARAEEAGGGPASDLAREYEGPVVACWYAKRGLLAPLFVATLASDRPVPDAALGALAHWALRGAGAEAPPGATADGAAWWQREVRVPHAGRNAKGTPEPAVMRPAIARHGRYVFFSTDARQVEEAVATAARRYPSLANALPDQGPMLAWVAPAEVAALLSDEVRRMLPADAEPLLRPAAERALLPRIAALANYAPHRGVLREPAEGTTSWRTLDWEPVAR